MTDLILSEESKEYQKLAREFFQNEVAHLSEKLDQEAIFPSELYKAAWELGLANPFIPEKFGGTGLCLWDSTVIAEEAGAASGGLASVFEGNALAIAPVLLAGSDFLKRNIWEDSRQNLFLPHIAFRLKQQAHTVLQLRIGARRAVFCSTPKRSSE